MKLLRLTTLCITCATLAACVSTPTGRPVAATSAAKPVPAPAAPVTEAQRRAEFDKSLARWHGADIKELRSKMGPPTTTQRLPDGKTSYVYAKTRTLQGPTGPYSFACTVGYVLDEVGKRVKTHWFEGC